MDANWLAERFDEHRQHLTAVAYRMLGSINDADDAVQEAWLRVGRADPEHIESARAFLTTVVSRVCLDMLRTRRSRREESLEARATDPTSSVQDPEREAVLADAVGLALLVVLQTLAPAERIAFVLHDMFAVPFDEIGPIVGRSSTAARQLASRARRRVQGTSDSAVDVPAQRHVVEAFLAGLRGGDIEALLAVLDPDVVVRADLGGGKSREVRGARTWASQAVAFAQGARFTHAALVNGAVGLIFAPRGRLQRALQFTIAEGRITHVDVVADPERVARLEVAVLD